MKSKIILTNHKDPTYIDIKKIIDNVDVWQTLDFECIFLNKKIKDKLNLKQKIYPISFATSTSAKKVYKYASINNSFEEFAIELIRSYEGGKIFVWDSKIENEILKLLIKETTDLNRKKILRIIKYNIIDLQKLFIKPTPLITLNNELQTSSLSTWSEFFDLEKSPISSKKISFIGIDIFEKISDIKNITETEQIKKYLEKTLIHNVIDVKTIYKLFFMIKYDSQNMFFLRKVESGEFEIK